MSRPSPGSKYRWLSAGLSRFGCSKTNGIPSRPSQKSIDVCRSAPTIVMWWTPWLCSLRMVSLLLDEPRLVLAALECPVRHEVDARPEEEHLAQAVGDPLGQRGAGDRLSGDLDA